MITDSFDITTPPFVTPEHFYGEQKQYCDICLCTFSSVIFEEALKRFDCEIVATMTSANGKKDVYGFMMGERRIGLFLMGIGSTVASTDVIELNWLTGATNFVMFGSAGNLNSVKTKGKYVIPTEAYRDEGMSYHYAPPSDYIKIANSDKMAMLFDQLGVPYIAGRVWTTDAFYRETKSQVAKRQEEGCLAVEMELAGVQAVCDFHGFSLYNFLAVGDVLDAPSYDRSELPTANHDMQKFYIALEIAKRL